LVTLQLRSSDAAFPSTTISSGDFVRIKLAGEKDDDEIISGVVYRMYNNKLIVALEDDLPRYPLFGDTAVVIKLANNITYTRHMQVLKKLGDIDLDRSNRLIRVLFGAETPRF